MTSTATGQSKVNAVIGYSQWGVQGEGAVAEFVFATLDPRDKAILPSVAKSRKFLITKLSSFLNGCFTYAYVY